MSACTYMYIHLELRQHEQAVHSFPLSTYGMMVWYNAKNVAHCS